MVLSLSPLNESFECRSLKMNFQAFYILGSSCILICAEALNLRPNNEMVQSMMIYYQSSCIIFITNHDTNVAHYAKLQKFYNSDGNYYYSSSMTLPRFRKASKLGYHGGKRAIVVLEYDNQMTRSTFAKVSPDIDMASYKWLIVTSKLNQKDFNELRIPIFCEFIIAEGGPVKGYALWEMYEVKPGTKITKYLGRWVAGFGRNGLEISSMSIYERRKDFEGADIRILTPQKDPCSATSMENGIATIAICIHKKIWDLHTEILNISTVAVIDHKLSLESIRYTDVDLTLRSAPMNTIDMDTRAYIWPTFRSQVEVYVSYVGQSVEWRTYIRPFNNAMWVVIIIWVVFSDFIMLFSQFIAYLKNKEENPFLDYYSKYSFISIFAFCNQGMSDTPTITSLRAVFFLMFVVPGVLIPGYSAVLTSFLTVQIPKMPFQNLEELSASDYSLGWHQSLPLKNMFNLNDTDHVNQALLQNNVLPQEKMPVTDIEGVNRMCSEKFTFLSIEVTVAALKPKCRFFNFKQHFKTLFTSIEMKKNTPYQYYFNRCERNIDYSGVKNRIEVHAVLKFIKLFKKADATSDGWDAETADTSPIRMENSVLPFIILLSGLILSFFIFALEVVFYKVTYGRHFTLRKIKAKLSCMKVIG